MENTKVLANFFRFTISLYDIMHLNFGVQKNEMYNLHVDALKEIEKENPDLDKIGSLLRKMEMVAEENNEPKDGFIKGCL